MNNTIKRVGAFALATTVFATSFAIAGSGAFAQDRAQTSEIPSAAETVQTDAEAAQTAPQPQMRFVATEVVQDLPAEPEMAETQANKASSLRQLVSTIDTSDTMSREVMCLAQAIYFEARGEPLEGQLAVARVIINRAESDRFPDDYCSVVTQRNQFSFVRGGHIPEAPRGTDAWNRAKAIARIAHRDLWESQVGDALYFHATHVSPSWAGRMTTRARIDNHIFYR